MRLFAPKFLVESQSPRQELEEGLPGGRFLLVSLFQTYQNHRRPKYHSIPLYVSTLINMPFNTVIYKNHTNTYQFVPKLGVSDK